MIQNMQSNYGMNYQANGTLPMPNQIMRPNNISNGFNIGANLTQTENKPKINNNLGFQMNPVSKNRKK